MLQYYPSSTFSHLFTSSLYTYTATIITIHGLLLQSHLLHTPPSPGKPPPVAPLQPRSAHHVLLHLRPQAGVPLRKAKESARDVRATLSELMPA